MKFLRYLLLSSLLIAPGLSRAESVGFHSTTEWIGVTTPSRPNEWIAFQREFECPAGKPAVRARIAADSKYWLWINGRLVVFEGGLKRGPGPDSTYFDVLDLSPHLKPGSNRLAILLWHFGKPGFSHVDSGRAGLLVEFEDISSGKLLLASDSTWRARLHPGYLDTEKPFPNYRLPESNIRFDARLDISGWTQTIGKPADWPTAVSLGNAGGPPWGGLVVRPTPQWRDFGAKEYTNASDIPKDSNALPKGLFVAKLPYNAQITPMLEIEAPAGLKIGMETDNYRGGGEPNIRAEYITRDGRQTYESLGWMNGHAVHYTMPPGVRIIGLKYRETGYDSAFTGSFTCDDPMLEKLHAKAARTLYVTMRDSYMDCPDRERAQWWGDAVLEIEETFYAMDRRSDALSRKAILELAAWQRPDGSLYSPIPATNWDKELPLQMLASVGLKGFWTYAEHSGDLETLRTVYPAVRSYLQLWKVSPEGRVAQRKGGWAWGDWGKNVDMQLLTDAWYHLALQGLRRMAESLDHPEDLPWIDDQMNRIATNFDAAYWKDGAYRSDGHQGRTDDRGNGLAVVAGLVPPSRFSELRQHFRAEFNASPYMEKYVLEALFLMGDADYAVARMKERYAKMVADPYLTTLWEGWALNTAEFGGGTSNHAWSGGPLTLMYQYLAGIRPTSPGYKTFQVLPNLGPLQRMRAVVPSAAGEIAVALERLQDDSQIVLDVVVPKAGTARVALPVREGRPFLSMTLNGTSVWSRGVVSRSLPTGVSQSPGNDPHVTFSLPPGKWRLLGTR